MLVRLLLVVGLVCSARGDAEPDAAAEDTRAPTVETDDGTFTGLLQRERNIFGKDEDFFVYLGIPYAQPPVGSLRWAPPERVQPLQQPFDATEFGPPCPAPPFPGLEPTKNCSEDCLTLNIFKSKPGQKPVCSEDRKKAALPKAVLVIIHGGGFVQGTAQFYPTKGILSNLVSRDIIVVSLNYRLGALGFLYDAPQKSGQNFGILDQLEALRWVQRNIGAFGGDPQRVTVYGESAGAISASMLSWMPEADDLFQQVFLQSGSAFVPGYFYLSESNSIVASSRRTAEALDCADASSYIECLRDNSMQQILDAAPIPMVDVLAPDAELPTDEISLPMAWGPVFEQSWAERRLTDRKLRATLAGVNRDEMALFVLPMFAPNNTFEHLNRQSLALHLPGVLGFFNEAANEKLQAAGASHYAQLREGQDADSHLTWLEQVVKMYSDGLLVAPTYLDALAASKSGAQVYLFSLDHEAAGLTETVPYPVVPHALDINYMLGQFDGMLSFEPNEDDWFMVDYYGRMVGTFVQDGVPSILHPPQLGELPEWPTVADSAGEVQGPQLMSLQSPPIVKPLADAQPTVSFWLTDVLNEVLVGGGSKDEL